MGVVPFQKLKPEVKPAVALPDRTLKLQEHYLGVFMSLSFYTNDVLKTNSLFIRNSLHSNQENRVHKRECESSVTNAGHLC